MKIILVGLLALSLTGCPSTTPVTPPPTCVAPACVLAATLPPTPGVGVAPGTTGYFQLFPRNEYGVAWDTASTPLNFVPVWTTSDTANVTITQIPNTAGVVDGLNATVAVAATYVPPAGAEFTVTVSNPNGEASTQIVVPYNAPSQGVSTYQPLFVAKSSVVSSYWIIQGAPPVNTGEPQAE